jgi:hypothetical protein
MKKYFTLATFFCLILLAACTEAPKPPACRDEPSLALITKIIDKSFQMKNKDLGASKATMSFAITNVIANSYDATAKRWSCSATVTSQATSNDLNAVNDFLSLGQQSAGTSLMFALPYSSFQTQFAEILPNVVSRDYRKFTEEEFTRQINYATQFDAQDQKSLVVELLNIDENIPLRMYTTLLAVRRELEEKIAKESSNSKANLSKPNATTTTNLVSEVGLLVKVQEFQMCGEESLCLKTDQGELRTNANALNDLQTNLLKEAIQQKSSLILKGVDKASMTFESIESPTK